MSAPRVARRALRLLLELSVVGFWAIGLKLVSYIGDPQATVIILVMSLLVGGALVVVWEGDRWFRRFRRPEHNPEPSDYRQYTSRGGGFWPWQ